MSSHKFFHGNTATEKVSIDREDDSLSISGTSGFHGTKRHSTHRPSDTSDLAGVGSRTTNLGSTRQALNCVAVSID